MGRRRSHEPFEHRREILRPIRSNANRDPDFYGIADTHCYCNADSNGDSKDYTGRKTSSYTASASVSGS